MIKQGHDAISNPKCIIFKHKAIMAPIDFVLFVIYTRVSF